MRFFASVHILLLVYIVAALIFWEMSLQKQSDTIYNQEVQLLKTRTDSAIAPSLFDKELSTLERKRMLRLRQYLGEGATFLVVILIGAVVVYSSLIRRMRLSRQQHNFMLSVTHELKSPLAAMKLNLQTLQKRKLDEDKKEQLIARCILESNRLNDLCSNMLLASQMEGRQVRPAAELFSLSDLLKSAIADYSQRYPRVFEQDIARGINYSGDRMMILMVVNNLLENAVKYTPTGKPIRLTLQERNKALVVAVSDEGPGIPDGEKAKIFHKFYRVGNEETRKAKGTGLGLYLTQRIVLQHKGRITVKDNTPSGSVFEIVLPAAPAG